MRMPGNNPDLFALILAFLMTLLGAMAGYAYRVINGARFSWVMLALQLIVSLFAGALMMLTAMHYLWPVEITGAICGMAGWSGSTLIKALEARFLNKAGGSNAGTQVDS
ncbi:hypothetical protein M2371_001934 [Buttiauxella sp. BIGb0471]|jgi:hypothetical protein|uniref:phage holin family protein n=1 Tax=unclassified Buttiauxella TaxID=2634062 RepID=UPI00106572C8|nr:MULTISPECIES: phage holin family protein [unclassified Buttiauxella]MCS3602725.1 hypothetical protein [Buttiauxella sp. BIGb0471]TDX14844.1 LydA family holin superfamily III [Buttiauxella sp. BIGb0552]